MLNRIGLAIVIAIIVTLVCILLGGILLALNIAIATTVGDFLKDYAGAIGILAGLWHFFANHTPGKLV